MKSTDLKNLMLVSNRWQLYFHEGVFTVTDPYKEISTFQQLNSVSRHVWKFNLASGGFIEFLVSIQNGSTAEQKQRIREEDKWQQNQK